MPIVRSGHIVPLCAFGLAPDFSGRVAGIEVGQCKRSGGVWVQKPQLIRGFLSGSRHAGGADEGLLRDANAKRLLIAHTHKKKPGTHAPGLFCVMFM